MNQDEKSTRWSRREFLGTSIGAGVLSLGSTPRHQAPATAAELERLEAAYSDNIYTQLLDVRPHLGAHEHLTRLGGSRMPREVTDAMVQANDYFVDMHELTEAAGRRVAEVMGAEAALVTSGAFSAIDLGCRGVPDWHRSGEDRRAASSDVAEARLPHSDRAPFRI